MLKSIALIALILFSLTLHDFPDLRPRATGEIVKVTQTDMANYPEVSLYVSVTDSSGQPVAGLTQSDFKVTEDGVPVTLTGFAGIGNTRAVDIVFVFDTTTSMGEEVDGMQRTSLAFAEKLQRSGNEYRLGLVDFGDVINRDELPDNQLTAEAQQFKGWINAIRLAGGGYEIPEFSLGALQRSAQMAFRDNAMKIVILITDAPPHHYGDAPDAEVSFNDQRLTLDSTLEALQAANITAYIIAPAHSDYSQIARETNGQWFDIHSGADFTGIIDQIGGLIATHYRLTYRSPRPTYDGTRRGILVETGSHSGSGTYLESHLLVVQSSPLIGLLCLLPLLGLLVLPVGLRQRAAPRAQTSSSEKERARSAAGFNCLACGTPLRPDAKFCPRCGRSPRSESGQSASLLCPQCKHPVRPQARFCGHCGWKL